MHIIEIKGNNCFWYGTGYGLGEFNEFITTIIFGEK